jgi:hypothetical protein
MRHRLGLTVGLALALTAAADPADTAPPSAEQLIEQLGHRDFKVREAAGKALAARGADAIAAMRKALGHPDPEVRQRLGQLVSDAERGVLLSPKRVSLSCNQTPVKDALADLTKQTGYRIELQGGGPPALITLDVANVTFWEALDKVSAQAGLVLQQHHDAQGGLLLYAQNAFTPYVDYRGPFRLAANSFHYNKSLAFATLPRNQITGSQRSEQLSFMFSVIAEPKLPLLGLGQAKLTLAVDDQDNSLLMPPVQYPVYEVYHGGYYGYRNLVLQTQVQLTGPIPGARAIRHMRGSLPVTLLAEQKPEIVVDRILEVKGKKFEGNQVSVEIEEVKDGPGKTYQVAMIARRAAKDANQYDYAWANSLHQRIELCDEKGNKFASHGFNGVNQTPNSVQGTFMFGDPGNGVAIGKPAKLTYYVWVTMQHQLEFEFRDLPLP